MNERDEGIRGSWPDRCEQRAFVNGAKWWQFHANKATAFPSEVDEMEDEAIRRFGDPAAAPSAEWVRGCEAMREADDELTRLRAAIAILWTDDRVRLCVPGDAFQEGTPYFKVAALLGVPNVDGRRYRVTTREVRDCTRCKHEAIADQPGKPDEFSCQVLDCCCIHKHGRCVVAA
jgi:hypothetical protein